MAKAILLNWALVVALLLAAHYAGEIVAQPYWQVAEALTMR